MLLPKRMSKKPLITKKANSSAIDKLNLTSSFTENMAVFKEKFKNCSDVVFREMEIGLSRIKAGVIYVDGLVNKDIIENQILNALMLQTAELEVHAGEEHIVGTHILSKIKERGMTAGEVKENRQIGELIHGILSGDAILFVDGIDQALIISARGWASRGIGEPETESLVRGPREGFTETIRFNTALLRRRLKNPDLKMEAMRIGARAQSDLVVAYIEGIVNQKVLQETKKRLNSIEIDGALESGYIEQLIEDNFLSPFPQVQYTERSDKVMAALLEGRVAILLDGTPFVLMVPATFPQFFQSPEDYYERWIIGSFTRSLRIVGAYIAAFAPAIFIATITYHPGLIPAKLMLAIAAAKEGVPFPAIVQAIIMELAFELFREAGARLPKPVGQTVGIVGGIIVGDAAVSANLASPIMLIVVALTAVASFTIPSYNLVIGIRLIRFPLMIAAAVLGFYGVMLGFIILQIHLASIKTFGVDYLSPAIPYQVRDWKDLFIRAPLHKLTTRPITTGAEDTVRQPKSDEGRGW
ncbi:spore germination protein [Bacillota bacterium LX-D]|nr:spore germination protein [Bacillota bacterium LX-D]